MINITPIAGTQPWLHSFIFAMQERTLQHRWSCTFAWEFLTLHEQLYRFFEPKIKRLRINRGIVYFQHDVATSTPLLFILFSLEKNTYLYLNKLASFADVRKPWWSGEGWVLWTPLGCKVILLKEERLGWLGDRWWQSLRVLIGKWLTHISKKENSRAILSWRWWC